MSFATAPVTHPHRARDALPSSQNRPLSARTRGDPGAPVGGVPVYHQLTKFLCFVHPRTGLVLPSTEVAGKPHADKIPPPLSVPSTWRGRLHLRDQIALARQLEFGKNLATQDALRRLLAPFFPAPDIPAVQVPPHVFGGHSNWEDVIDCLLFFFSLDTKLQEEHLQAATESRSKWYKKNIDVLCENRPTSYHIVMRFFPPSPGDEIIAAVRSKNTPSLAKLEAKWDARLQQLKKFKEQHGHCNVPSKHPGGLGHWASNQRSKKKSRRLDAGRTQKLEELGFQWEMLKIQPWEVRFQQLKEFKAEHGHCNIPKKHPGGLGQWVNYQRTMKKSQHLDAVRTQKLEELGFQWEATKSQPWENLDEGEPAPSDDAAETGRSPPAATRQGAIVGKRPEKRRHVPRRFKRNADDGEPAPSSVVAKQDRQWESQLRKLKEFKEEHGHCHVPSKRPGGLGRWVEKQRSKKRSQRLDDSRIQKLEAL